MGRHKGGTNKKYSVEDKLKIINRYLDQHESLRELGRELGISHQNIGRWIVQYDSDGAEGLKPKKKGNPYSALHTSKSLSELDRLRLENMKLKVELARAKKGYTVKGVGSKKEYVTLNGKNIKSQKNSNQNSESVSY